MIVDAGELSLRSCLAPSLRATRTPCEILTLGAQALERAPRNFALPLASLPVLGLVFPLLREMTEMRLLWDRL